MPTSARATDRLAVHDVMWEVTRLFDPAKTHDPSVMLTDDPRAHAKNLKTTPLAEAEVARCVERGRGEPARPSRGRPYRRILQVLAIPSERRPA